MQSNIMQFAQAPSIPFNLNRIIPVAWFFLFQPFLSPIPTANDLQPIGLLLSSVVLFFNGINSLSILKKFSFILFFSLMIEAFHFILFERVAFIYIATYIYAVFSWKYVNWINASMIGGLLLFNFLGICWYIYEPSSYHIIIDNLLNVRKNIGNSARGSPGFTPEPGFAAGLSTAYAIVYYRFFSQTERKIKNLLYFIVYLLSIYLTASATGYFFIPVVVMTWFFTSQKRPNFFVLLSFFVVILIFISIFPDLIETSQRGLVLLKKLFSNPELLLLDASVQERVRSLYIGYQSIVDDPMGLGHGNFSKATASVSQAIDLKEIFSYSRNIEGSASGLGSVMAGTGILGVIFFLVVFLGLRGRVTRANLGLWIVSLAMFTFSFSPAFPIIYVILVMAKKFKGLLANHKKSNRRVLG